MIGKLTAALAMTVFLVACDSHEETSPVQATRSMTGKSMLVHNTLRPAFHVTPASVVAQNRAEVASRLMGYISEIAVAEGQAVSRGQRLFTVDPIDVQGQVEQAQASVTQAESAFKDAKTDFDRFSNLFKENVVSRQQLDKARLQYEVAGARLEQAKAGLGTASGQLRYATVSAPITGVITSKLASTGDLAAPGKPILVVEDTTRMQVETQVPESVLARLKPGQVVAVEVDGVPGQIEGRVARISPAADPVSRTFLVKLDVTAQGLRSGAFARVNFPDGESSVLSIPTSALINRAGIEGVFVLDKDAIAHFRMVRLGARSQDGVEVQAGLRAGERIVTEGAQQLECGDKVTG